MKKFKYKLESYLKYLKFQRESSLKEVHRSKKKKDKLIEQYQWMEQEMKKAYLKNSQFGQNFSDIHLVNDNNAFLSILKVQMKELSQEIAEAEERYQEDYKKLLELQVKIKKIENHKETKSNEFKKAYNKKVQKQTDEMNSSRRGGRHAKSI